MKHMNYEDNRVIVDVKVFNSSDVGLPRYAHPGDSGVDLYAVEDTVVHPNSTVIVKTGLHVAIPKSFELQIRSRSGLALKHGIFVLNSPGTIDSGYRNQIGVILYNTEIDRFNIKKGDRIAQAVLCPVMDINWVKVDTVEELDKTDRNLGGFGSTGV